MGQGCAHVVGIAGTSPAMTAVDVASILEKRRD
jgi:hypothetical protein